MHIKRTKIVATIGPSSSTVVVLKKMIHAGMNVARLNFSHGTHESHAQTLKNIRQAVRETGIPVSIIGDLQGPKVRLGVLPKPLSFKVGESVVISTALNEARGKTLPCTYKGLHKDVKPGDTILLTDGLLEFQVTKVAGREIRCKVVLGGTLTSHKGLVVPTNTLHVPLLSEKDKADLEFAIKNDVDFIAMSFVTKASDVVMMRRLIAAAEKKYHRVGLFKNPHETATKIIVKLEKHEGVTNFDEILAETDALMVARGDLGVEIPMETVPIVQKMMIAKCLQQAKPVITATQMLLSMVQNPRPTRAEVSDVANAVIDHTDAVMLSDESAIGKYPVEAIAMMSRIAEKTESSPYDNLVHAGVRMSMLTDASISSAASDLARIHKADAIVVATLSGHTARLVSAYRPELPIFASAQSDKLARQMNLSWGVTPFRVSYQRSLKMIIKNILKVLKKQKLSKTGDEIVMVAGDPPGVGVVNYVKVEKIL
jgi:pyruvate kinase